MKFVSIYTTDNQWLGLHFELPDAIQAPFEFPVAADTSFRVDKIVKSEKEWTFSNPHYIVVARVIE